MALQSLGASPQSPSTAAPVPAAQYVRMSTEHQKYSTANQADAILRYAAARGFTIVRSYEDAGKSGLRLDGRDALQRLIADVRAGTTDFRAVLVYDVSRWGRFQDADESAYYEFVCKEAGILVHYCAEQFENDGSLSATIIKSMKRAMAGEYSRELSAKVFAGQCRLISLGFRQGGPAGFGLRRQLIDEHRQPKGELARGLQKSLQTDRVVLTVGPDHEVDTVRRIYRLFVENGETEREIATRLNDEGGVTDLGRPWTRGTVHQVLTNEKYVGHNVYNRTSFKLKAKRVVNPPDMWVRANGAFAPIVDVGIFATVQGIIQARSRRFSDAELLESLTALLRRRGSLSGLLIDEQDAMPSSSAFRSRFGSLLRAYQLVGYTPARDYQYVAINRALRQMHAGVVAEAVTAISQAGGEVHRDPATDLLRINDEFTASIAISRCLVTPNGARRWHVRFDASLHPDITVAVRMDAGNREALDYFVLPRVDVDAPVLRLADENGARVDAYRTDTLSVFFQLAGRTPLGEVA